MSMSSSTSKRCQGGAVMVEFAILFTVLVILFVGITELGRALFFQHKLLKAVESGARFMGRGWEAVDPETCAEDSGWDAAVTAATNLAVYGRTTDTDSVAPAITNFDPTDVTVSVEARDVTDVGTVCVVRVDASVLYAGLFFGGGGFLPPIIMGGDPGGSWTLTASSEERYVGD